MSSRFVRSKEPAADWGAVSAVPLEEFGRPLRFSFATRLGDRRNPLLVRYPLFRPVERAFSRASSESASTDTPFGESGSM